MRVRESEVVAAPSGAGEASCPQVSILIPCYNAELWIGSCIRSALGVPYPNKEVIVLDDGSTDRSLEVIRSFGDQIQVHPGLHKGANAARNRLTALAKGEWLQYLDADDLLLPGKLTAQIKLVSQHNDPDVIYSPMICRDVHWPERDFETKIESDDEILNFIRWEPFNTIGMLLRREAVLNVGGWKEDQRCCQEHELLLRFLMAGKRFAASKQPGAVAQFHGSDSVSHRDPARVIHTRMEITDRAAEYLEYTGGLTPVRRRALLTARLESARSLYQWNPSAAQELCKKALRTGPWPPESSPALRKRYQVALRTVGFLGAERIAAKLRRQRASEPPQVAGDSSKPLISILIPCYNAERWIAQCITSALEQDYPEKEVIVVDDGSTDASLKIIQAFGDRIRCYPGPHVGGNAARNRLTSLARGEWLQYLDADDYLLPEKLKRQVDLLALSGSADVIYAPVICQSSLLSGMEHATRIQSGDAVLNFIRWEPFQTTGMLFRRRAVLEAGGWKEDQPCCQEHELVLRLLTMGSRFVAQKERGSVYRVFDASVSRKDPLRVVKIRMEITDRAVEYLRSTGELTRERRKAVFVARMESARSVVAKDPQLAEEFCKKAFAIGRLWGISSPALRLRYQIAFRLLGFRRTERFAAWARELRGGRASSKPFC